MGGLWCRLVPAEEVERLNNAIDGACEAFAAYVAKCSYCNGSQQDDDGEQCTNKPCPKCRDGWEAITRLASAKRVMEGEV
jgi:hypothetical protein